MDEGPLLAYINTIRGVLPEIEKVDSDFTKRVTAELALIKDTGDRVKYAEAITKAANILQRVTVLCRRHQNLEHLVDKLIVTTAAGLNPD